MLSPKRAPAIGAWVLGGVGVAALATGATFLILSNAVSLPAARTATSSDELGKAVEAGRMQGVVGVTSAAVGAAAIVGAVVWGIARGGEPKGSVSVAVVPAAGGAMVGIGGQW
jgi:hypothetical protein